MKRTFFILFLLLFNAVVFAEDVSVNVSRREVGANESFTVEFSSGQKMNEQPDFAPLENDFDILSNSQGYHTSIINGVISQKASWQLELVPKHEGKLVIPPIQFGKSSSQPVVIEVTPAKSGGQKDSLYLEAEVSPKEGAYEQSQLIYTLRLCSTLNISQGAISEVTVNDPDAMIEKLGKDIQYEKTQKNGSRVTVLERKYAVFPQRAGELIFSPVIFEGRIMIGTNFFNAQTQFKRVSSNEVKVEVKPIPSPFQKHNWLAAENVTLVEAWSADPSKITLGEPITWTLTLTADGCLGSQIPAIPILLPKELKQYEDKPEISNKPKENGNIGVRETKIALIATKPGTLELPEITVKWWDVKADKIKEAKLPARTITVEAGQVALNTVLDEQTAAVSHEDAQSLQESSVQSQLLPVWAWCLIGLNAIWIIGLAFFAFKKLNLKSSRKHDSAGQIRSQLKKACQIHDAKLAEASLLSWAGLISIEGKPQTLMGLKPHVSKELQEAIDELNQALYGRKSGWEGESLWQAFAAFKLPKKAHSNKKAEEPILKKLYQ